MNQKLEANLLRLERALTIRMARGFQRAARRADIPEQEKLAAMFAEERAKLAKELPASLGLTLAALRRSIRLFQVLAILLLCLLVAQWFWFTLELSERTPTHQQIQWMMRGYALDHPDCTVHHPHQLGTRTAETGARSNYHTHPGPSAPSAPAPLPPIF